MSGSRHFRFAPRVALQGWPWCTTDPAVPRGRDVVLDQGDEAIVGGRLVMATPTLVRVTSSWPGAPEGALFQLAAQLRTTRQDGPAPTGSVVFRAGHRVLGTAPVDGAGMAVIDDVALSAGVHAVVASYSGDAHHAAATSAPYPQAVAAPLLQVVLAVAAPVERPEGILLEAELLEATTGRLLDASGTVLFSVEGVEIAHVVLVAGQARIVVPGLPPGRLVGSFPGEGEYAPATGMALQAVSRS